MSDLIQHVELGQSRVALQYTQSQKFLAYLEALLKHADELESVLRTVALQMDIDIAEGVNLDVIGDLVGIERVLPESVQLSFFGFAGYANADVFGEYNVSGVGGRLRNNYESGSASSVLDDAEYRILIRSKIIKNHSHCVGEDMISGLRQLLNTSAIYVHDYGSMTIGVAIGRILSFSERALLKLDILPRPSSVRMTPFTMYDAGNYFGFAGQSGAKPFGELGSPSIGGRFAEAF